MKIRKARPEDVEEVCKMHRMAIRKINSKDYPKEAIKAWSNRSTPERMLKPITNTKVDFLVAEENGRIIGFADLWPNELGGLYVHPNWVGKGIGKKLFKKIELIAKRKGYKKLKLVASITAFDFYKKAGFKKIRRGKHNFGKIKIDIYHMRKYL